MMFIRLKPDGTVARVDVDSIDATALIYITDQDGVSRRAPVMKINDKDADAERQRILAHQRRTSEPTCQTGQTTAARNDQKGR